ncbi:MAG: hypothetical protein ACLFT0_04070 [Spirulinaceae cyanobacterium]
MIYAKPTEQPPKQLIVNPTGEPYQPARLYYTIHNKKTVIRAFQKLRCIKHDPKYQSWDWYYEAEAQKLRFEKSYNKIPKEERPVLLGVFFFRSDTEMILELDSAFHVPIALEFFDKRINRRAAEATKMRLVNRFYSTEDDEEQATNRKYTLDSDRVALPPEADFKRIIESYDNEEDRMQALNDYMDEITQKPLPEVQELPIHYYEEGLAGLNMVIELHAVEALERWRGHSITQYDLLQEMEEREEMADFIDFLKNASEDEIENLKKLAQEIQQEIDEEEETVEVEGVTVTEEADS